MHEPNFNCLVWFRGELIAVYFDAFLNGSAWIAMFEQLLTCLRAGARLSVRRRVERPVNVLEEDLDPQVCQLAPDICDRDRDSLIVQ